MPKFKRHTDLKWKHSVVLEVIVSSIVRCILRYLLMAAYLWTCNEFGLFNHSFMAKVVIWLTSICVSRMIMREIGIIIFGDKTDDELFNTVGIVECIRSIMYAIGRW